MLKRLRGGFPLLLQLAGLAAVAVGLALVFLPAGIIAAGLGLFGVGWLYDQRPAQ
jgi:hypothetical protein